MKTNWDLTVFYKDFDDPAFKADLGGLDASIAALTEAVAAPCEDEAAKLTALVGQVEALGMTFERLMLMVELTLSVDAQNKPANAALAPLMRSAMLMEQANKPAQGVDFTGTARVRYANDVAYDYCRALENEIGIQIFYLPEWTPKANGLIQHEDVADFAGYTEYFEDVLAELKIMKAAYDLYPDGFLKEMAARKGNRKAEIILCPYTFEGISCYGVHVYDSSGDAQKVDQIYYTGSGNAQYYSHEMGHMRRRPEWLEQNLREMVELELRLVQLYLRLCHDQPGRGLGRDLGSPVASDGYCPSGLLRQWHEGKGPISHRAAGSV